MKVRWSPTARLDLICLREYIASRDPRAAQRIARLILKHVETVREHPAIGRTGRVADTREMVVSGTPYIIVYAVIDRVLHVLAVLHSSRRWPA